MEFDSVRPGGSPPAAASCSVRSRGVEATLRGSLAVLLIGLCSAGVARAQEGGNGDNTATPKPPPSQPEPPADGATNSDDGGAQPGTGTSAQPPATPPGDADADAADDDDDLAALRREAEAAAGAAAPDEEAKASTPKVFTSGQRSLQAENPEISVISDAGGQLVASNYDLRSLDNASHFYFRTVGVHIEANLDPYSFFKSAIEVHPDGVEFAEAYGTWIALLPRVNVTLGKFRQQFGVVNRYHEPPMDQYDRPLALTTMLGEDGLNSIGASAEIRLPVALSGSHTLTLQATDPINDTLFTGQQVGIPTGLFHLRNFWGLSDSTYLELGLSGLTGVNDDAHHLTSVGGVDLTVSWKPHAREEYEGVMWRSELFAAHKTLMGPDINALGGYSYVDVKVSQTVNVGLRGDVTQALATGNSGQWSWQAVPYVTWWQSKWVRLRLQFNHLDAPNVDPQDTLTLQVMMAVGPHKHDRY